MFVILYEIANSQNAPEKNVRKMAQDALCKSDDDLLPSPDQEIGYSHRGRAEYMDGAYRAMCQKVHVLADRLEEAQTELDARKKILSQWQDANAELRDKLRHSIDQSVEYKEATLDCSNMYAASKKESEDILINFDDIRAVVVDTAINLQNVLDLPEKQRPHKVVLPAIKAAISALSNAAETAHFVIEVIRRTKK